MNLYTMPYLLSMLLGIYTIPLCFMFMMNNNMIILKWEMIISTSMTLETSLILDKISLSFSIVIMIIFSSVMVFSEYYMNHEINKPRFIWIVMLFVISMLSLIFIPNLIILLLGWDGLGITSFCLVIFYQNYKSLMSGMVTALMNRLGDAAIIIGIAWMTMNMQWSIFLFFAHKKIMLMFLLIFAAMTKSAQIPFSSWLPAAMAAPTPVSALVHSSTLVTAGVFLMIRFFPFVSSFKLFKSSILLVGASTMMMASLAALKENDMKKIIALSTLSQLGIMFMSLSLYMPSMALFHLYTHAMFKAMLFILAGILIFMNSGNQDIRSFGSSNMMNMLISMMFNICNLALCSLPFLAGFYSKEHIINLTMSSSSNIIGSLLIMFSIPLTILYSLRLSFIMMMLMKKSSYNSISKNTKQPKFLMIATMLMLLMVISTGSTWIWLIQPIFNLPFINNILSTLPIFLIFTTFITITMIMCMSPLNMNKSNTNSTMLVSMWFLNYTSFYPLTKSFFYYSKYINKLTDSGWSEYIGPQGMFNFNMMLNKNLKLFMHNTITASFILMSMTMIYMITT